MMETGKPVRCALQTNWSVGVGNADPGRPPDGVVLEINGAASILTPAGARAIADALIDAANRVQVAS